MEPLRRAVACHCLPAPIRRSFRAAVEIGATGIQFDVRQELRSADLSDSGRRQFRHDLEIEGLSISSLSFPTRRSLYDPEQLEARISGLKQALEFAYQLHVPIVVARVGAIPPDKDSPDFKSLVEVLNDVARYSNRVGATLAITPTRDSAADLKGLIDHVKDGLVGINFDPAVFAMCGRDAVAAFRELHKQVLHITARDGVRDIDGSGQEVTLGRGDVDWPELLALLA
ncbi:MAG: sugar phosphate isomerase/epimerase, partial [Planctomycetaceae bacterium]|nr:sugar phosphate isomerase/epimerase [Planctomycetaceae bacterium]